jgi:transposase
MKQFRRIFTRFEKLDARYLVFRHLAEALIWLR